MLSYMVPMEEKPPPVPGKGRMALELAFARSSASDPTQRTRSAISKESSTSSFASDLTSATASSSMTPTSAVDKPKHKLLANGTKHTTLKRVSFGSSKGSMVETLIYESPLQEEAENSPPPHNNQPIFPPAPPEDDSERSKVRVSFYQGVQPQCVSPPPTQPDPPHAFIAALLAYSTETDMAADTMYNRQISTESGWDNPFRPDGDLSREADEIVSLIKGGKPITPTPPVGAPHSPTPIEEKQQQRHADNLNANVIDSPVKAGSPVQQKATTVNANGTKNGAPGETRLGPGPVDVQRSPSQEPQQAEHVLIKKKPKCKCCVVQ